MEQSQLATESSDTASEPYIGQWHRLVSTTNWEKGRIIHEWRSALIAVGAAATEYSDEAWSRKVGTVSGQHVGRLRRVYDRFGAICDQFGELYWSHFQSALDWDDAEMWLEGASQCGWSVSQMRRQRWEAMGAVRGQEPHDDEIVVAERDEDVEPHSSPDNGTMVAGTVGNLAEARSPAGPDFGDEDIPASHRESPLADLDQSPDDTATVAFVRPFENLADLPADLADAFEAFKLAILLHKGDGWSRIPREDVLAALDALKQLACSPTASEAPF